jgi:hypothetical protein
MRLAFSIWFSLILLFVNLHQSLAYAVFQSNQETLADEKCLERGIEGNSCQGACVLKELLQPTPQKERSPFTTPVLKLDELFANVAFDYSFEYQGMVETTVNTDYLLFNAQFVIFKIWNPPKGQSEW